MMIKIMQKKILCILICALLFTVITSRIMAANLYIEIDSGITSIDPEYIIDQKQIQHSHESNIHSSTWIAQSFKPSMTPLTKIQLKINKPCVIDRPLSVSIRKNLNGSDLTYISIPSSEIPYFVHWTEFNFPDIEVEIDEIYYIIVWTISPAGKSYTWLDEYDDKGDPYIRGKQWQSNNYGVTWSYIDPDSFYVDSTFRTYSYITYPDLECEGNFSWTDVKPGEIVTGSFTVENIGTPLSYLNWEIVQWPTWGTWTLTPSSGINLKPEDGVVNVQISVEAPHSDIPDEYYGEIRIINQDNPDDHCKINARLVTPKCKNIVNSHPLQFLKEILQNFPFIQWLLESCPPK